MRPNRKAVFLSGAIVVLGGTSPALAEDGGLHLSFDIAETLRYATNPSLSVPPGLDASLSETRLGFQLDSATASENVSFSASAALQTLLGEGTSEFSGPKVALTYGRESRGASLSVEANYSRDAIEFLHPLEDFIDSEGMLVFPDDVADLYGTGWRSVADGRIKLELGRTAPVGAVFEFHHDETNYLAASNPDLNDSSSDSGEATAILRFSQTGEGRLNIGREVSSVDDAAGTETDRRWATLGLEQDLSPVTRFEAEIGLSEIDTLSYGLSSQTREQTGALRVQQEFRNGKASAELALTADGLGRWQTFTMGRTLEFQTARLRAELGLTRPEGGGATGVGQIAWEQALPHGALRFEIGREVGGEADGSVNTDDRLALMLRHEWGEGAFMGLSLARLNQQSTGANTVMRTDLLAQYGHEIGADWELNFGVNLSQRYEETVGSADSRSIFLTINRSFGN